MKTRGATSMGYPRDLLGCLSLIQIQRIPQSSQNFHSKGSIPLNDKLILGCIWNGFSSGLPRKVEGFTQLNTFAKFKPARSNANRID
jgi:hypothetical protein